VTGGYLYVYVRHPQGRTTRSPTADRRLRYRRRGFNIGVTWVLPNLISTARRSCVTRERLSRAN
jgi:hypothetical protein